MKPVTILLSLCLFFLSCSDTIDNTGTCSDGIQNQGEQGIDCGGPCGAVCPSCADGIMNQDETAVDCGGSCDPCYPRMSAEINDTVFNSGTRNAFLSGPGTIRIYGTNQVNSITLYYSGNFTPSTVVAGPQFTGEFRDADGNLFTSVQGGSITFSTFDTLNRSVSGIFNFLAVDPLNSDTVSVQSGIFNSLSY